MPLPAPDEDQLDTIPSPQLLYYVEQSLLGALLTEPWRINDVPGIGPDSFAHRHHAALFAAIRSLPTPDPAQHAKNTKWLDAVLTAAHEQARGLTASYLHSLIHLCLWPPHAPAYARLVQGEHARRLLRTAAQRLAQTAQDTSLPHPVTATLSEADTLATVVDNIAAQFPPHSGSRPRTATPPPAAAQDQEQAVDEERLLLATATAYPDDAAQMRWLTPSDFTLPLHGELWQSITSLSRRGVPVDPVTVLWEARHGIPPDADPTHLLDLLGAPVGSSEHWGEHVLQRSVLATAHHTARCIVAFTDDPATTPHHLVVGSRRALASLSAVRSRWHHATAPAPAPSPTRTRTAGSPRAGPPRTAPPLAPRFSR